MKPDNLNTAAPWANFEAWTEEGTCSTHGAYTRQRFGPKRRGRIGCPQCEDEREAEARLRAEQDRLAEDRQRLAERIDESGLRGRFKSATFQTFTAQGEKQRKVLEACKAFAAGPLNEWRTLVLVGPCGTGKTHLGAAMALATIARGGRARMATARDVVRELRATWRRDSEHDEEAVIRDYAHAGMLVVDELGVGFGSDAELTQLLDVIDRRYQLLRPLVVISNLTIDSLRAAVGDRLYDRLREGAQVLTCNWQSHRGAT